MASKKKIGLITGSGVTALGGVITAIAVPMVQRVDKDEDVMYTLLNKIHELNDKQEINTNDMIKDVKSMFNAFATDIREAVRNIYQKIHDTEMKIQENKHKIEMVELKSSREDESEEEQ